MSDNLSTGLARNSEKLPKFPRQQHLSFFHAQLHILKQTAKNLSLVAFVKCSCLKKNIYDCKNATASLRWRSQMFDILLFHFQRIPVLFRIIPYYSVLLCDILCIFCVSTTAILPIVISNHSITKTYNIACYFCFQI